jgi:hypothetical protein
VRIAEQPVNGINPQDVADALSSSGGKGKKLKAYRRSDAHFSMWIIRVQVQRLLTFFEKVMIPRPGD